MSSPPTRARNAASSRSMSPPPRTFPAICAMRASCTLCLLLSLRETSRLVPARVVVVASSLLPSAALHRAGFAERFIQVDDRRQLQAVLRRDGEDGELAGGAVEQVERVA